MRTEEELNQLAIDVITNKTYLTNIPEMVMTSFMVLKLMSREQMEEFVKNKPVAFFEDYDKAGPRSINDLPVFFSMNWLSEDEWNMFVPIMQAKEQALGIASKSD